MGQCGAACSTRPLSNSLWPFPTADTCLQVPHPPTPKVLGGVFKASPRTLVISAQPCPSPLASWNVPFCTLSHSRKISSPPRQLPEFRFTRQIFSSAVLGAPEDIGIRKEALNHQRSPGLACRRCNLLIHPRVKFVRSVWTAPPRPRFNHSHRLLTTTNSSAIYLPASTTCPALFSAWRIRQPTKPKHFSPHGASSPGETSLTTPPFST